MNKVQDTRGYERYMAMDIHREYVLVGAWNEEKDWVLLPRRVGTEKFPEWAKKNIRAGDIVGGRLLKRISLSKTLMPTG